MKRYFSYLLSVILVLTALTGCQKKADANLFTFQYGCSLQQAMDVLGLTEADVVSTHEWEDGSVEYGFSNPQLLSEYGEGGIVLTDDVLQFHNGEKYPLGITEIEVVFAKEDALQQFLDRQTKDAKQVYTIKDDVGQFSCGYGDWNDYRDSKQLPVLEQLASSEFDAEKWQMQMPLVNCIRIFEANVYGEYRCNFSGRNQTIAAYTGDIQMTE